MNATELMAEQHHAIEDLLRAVDGTDVDDRARLRELAERLAAHMRIEEEILFPLARTTGGDLDERTICARVLQRMTAPDAMAGHAKLAVVVELAEAHLDGAHDAYDDMIHHAIDHETVEDIGESLATIFEDGVRAAEDRVSRRLRTGGVTRAAARVATRGH